MDRQSRILVPVVLLVALVTVAGCKHKVQQSSQPVAPPITAPAPTANITASPGTVSAGDQVVLTWKTTNADHISIDGLGDVASSGVKTVTPTASTSYHLVARGDGGTADDVARVTVNAPPAVVTPANTMSAEEEFRKNIQDIFFDYDKAEVRSDAQTALARDASFLASHPAIKVLIGGYCDERGSDEYNLALGQNRADTTKKDLIAAGVSPSRIRVISYGKEKPFCSDATEACWQQNRRAGFTMDR